MPRETRSGSIRTGTLLYWSLSVAAAPRFRVLARRARRKRRRRSRARQDAPGAGRSFRRRDSGQRGPARRDGDRQEGQLRSSGSGQRTSRSPRTTGRSRSPLRPSTAIAATSAPDAAPAAATATADNAGLAPHYFVFFFDDQRGHSVDVPGTAATAGPRRQGRHRVAARPASRRPTGWRWSATTIALKLFQDFSQDREALERAIQAATTGRGGTRGLPVAPGPAGARSAGARPGLPVGDALSQRDRHDLRSAHAGRRRPRRRSSDARTSCSSRSASAT